MKNDEVFSFNDMKFYSKIVVAFIDKKEISSFRNIANAPNFYEICKSKLDVPNLTYLQRLVNGEASKTSPVYYDITTGIDGVSPTKRKCYLVSFLWH